MYVIVPALVQDQERKTLAHIHTKKMDKIKIDPVQGRVFFKEDFQCEKIIFVQG